MTQLVVTTLILLLIQIMFDLRDASGLKDAECCSLVYVDSSRTELSDDDVLPFPVGKLFPQPYAANLSAEKWKMTPTGGL